MEQLVKNKLTEKDVKEIYNYSFIDWNIFRDTKVLITGSTGLIGNQIVNSLVFAAKENDFKMKILLPVRNLGKAKKYYKASIRDGFIKLYKYDTNKPIKLKKIDNIDYVIHCANSTSSQYFAEEPIENIGNIANGTKNLLNYLKDKNIKSFVYLSSMEVYGQFPDKSKIECGIKEDELGYIDISDTRSSYPEGKRVAELICNSFFKKYNIPVKIIRLAQVIGANAHMNDKKVINYFASCVIKKEDIVLKTDGEKIQSCCYITDVICGIFKVLIDGIVGETYNLTNSRNKISIKDLAKNLCDRYHINYSISLNRNIGEIYNKTDWCILNTDKLEKLGWNARVDLNESLGRLISSFYRQKIVKSKTNNKYNVFEKVFSIKNNDRHKIFCIFGIKIKFPIKLRNKFYCWFYRTFWGIKKNKIIICNFYGRGYGCNLKYITEEIIKRGLNYDIVWLIGQDSDSYDLPKSIRKVGFGSKKALFELSTAKLWIFNQRNIDFIINKGITKGKKQIYIQTWHGSLGIKKLNSNLENNFFTHHAKWLKLAKLESDSINYFLSNSEFETNVIRNSMWYDGKICLFGHPRNDIFFYKNLSIKKKIANKYKFDENSKIILYVPSFRDDYRVDCYLMEYEKLLNFLDGNRDDWKLLIRFHPNVASYAKFLVEYKENIINVSWYPDIQELLYIADMAITDYSSCIFDFMLSKKPAFIFATDIEKYNNDRGFYYPLEEAPFSIATNTDELIENIRNFNHTKYEKEVEEFIKSKGCIEDGRASERTVDLIENIMNKKADYNCKCTLQ